MANFVIQKKYTNNLEYITDVAKSTGIYSESIARDPNVGYLYTNWLANKKLEGADLKPIIDVDTSYLSSTDAFFYMQNKLGDLSDDDFVSMFDDKDQFYKTFGSVQGYFDTIKEDGYKTAVYNSLSGVEKAFNTVGYVLSQAVSGLASTVEGVIDIGAGAVGAIGGIFDSGFREDVEDFVKKDTTGAGSLAQELEEFKHYNIDITDNQWHIANILGSVANNFARSLVMAIPYAGFAVYVGGMSGNILEETLQSNPNATLYSAGANALIQGAIEGVTEKLFANPLWGKGTSIIKSSGKAVTNPLLQLGKTMFEEGVEELVAEALETPLQAAFNGESITFAEVAENAAFAAVVGALSGGLSYGAAYLKTKPITIDGKTLTKAQTISLQERLSDATKLTEVFNKVSQVDVLRTKYNLSSEDISKLDSKTYTDSKIQKEYDSAKKNDTALKEAAVEEALGLGVMFESIGVEKFTKAVELLKQTNDSQTKVIDIMADFVNGSSDYLTDNNISDVAKYNETNTNGLTFVPITSETASDLDRSYRASVRMDNFRKTLNKIFGKDFVFGIYATKSNVQDNNQIISSSGNTVMLDYDKFDAMSPKEALNIIFAYNTAQSLASDKSLISDDIRTQLLVGSKLNKLGEDNWKRLGDSDIINGILSDKQIATTFFGVSKESSVGLFKKLQELYKKSKSKTEAEYILRTLLTYKKNIIDSINSQYKQEASKRFVIDIESLKSDSVRGQYIEEKLQKTPTPRVPGYYVFANTSSTGKFNSVYNAELDLIKLLKEPSDSLNSDLIYSSDYYADSFVKEITDKYKGRNFLENLNSYLYDSYGIVYVPYAKNFMQPMNLNSYMNTDILNDVLSRLETSDSVVLYPEEIFSNAMFSEFPLMEQYATWQITFEKADPNESSYADFNEEKIYINVNQEGGINTSLVHEFIHLFTAAHSELFGSPSYAISDALAKIYSVKTPVTKYDEFISIATGESLEDISDLSNAEKAEILQEMLYKYDFGEALAEYSNGEVTPEKARGLAITGFYIDYNTGIITGTGKFKNFILELDKRFIKESVSERNIKTSKEKFEQKYLNPYNEALDNSDPKVLKDFFKSLKERDINSIRIDGTDTRYLVDYKNLSLVETKVVEKLDVKSEEQSDVLARMFLESQEAAKVSAEVKPTTIIPTKYNEANAPKSILDNKTLQEPSSKDAESSIKIYKELKTFIGNKEINAENLLAAGLDIYFVDWLLTREETSITKNPVPTTTDFKNLLTDNTIFNENMSDKTFQLIVKFAFPENKLNLKSYKEYTEFIDYVIPYIWYLGKIDGGKSLAEKLDKTTAFSQAKAAFIEPTILTNKEYNYATKILSSKGNLSNRDFVDVILGIDTYTLDEVTTAIKTLSIDQSKKGKEKSLDEKLSSEEDSASKLDMIADESIESRPEDVQEVKSSYNITLDDIMTEATYTKDKDPYGYNERTLSIIDEVKKISKELNITTDEVLADKALRNDLLKQLYARFVLAINSNKYTKKDIKNTIKDIVQYWYNIGLFENKSMLVDLANALYKSIYSVQPEEVVYAAENAESKTTTYDSSTKEQRDKLSRRLNSTIKVLESRLNDENIKLSESDRKYYTEQYNIIKDINFLSKVTDIKATFEYLKTLSAAIQKATKGQKYSVSKKESKEIKQEVEKVVPKEVKPIIKPKKPTLKNKKEKLKVTINDIIINLPDSELKSNLQKSIDNIDSVSTESDFNKGINALAKLVAQTNSSNYKNMTPEQGKVFIKGLMMNTDNAGDNTSLYVYKQAGAFGKTTKSNVQDILSIKPGGFESVLNTTDLINWTATDFVEIGRWIKDSSEIPQLLKGQLYVAYYDFIYGLISGENFTKAQGVLKELQNMYVEVASTLGYTFKTIQTSYNSQTAVDTLMDYLRFKFGENYVKSINEKEIISKENRKKLSEEVEKVKNKQVKNFEEIKANIKDLKEKIKSAKEINILTRELQTALNELSDLKQELSVTKKREVIDELNRQISELQKKIDELNKQIYENSELETKLSALTEELNKQTRLNGQLQRLIAGLKANDQTEILNAMNNISEEQSSDDISKAFKELILPNLKKRLEEDQEEIKDSIKKEGSKAEKIYKAVQTWRYMALLSSPTTWFRNIMVNYAVRGVDNIATWIMTDERFTKLANRNINWNVVENGLKIGDKKFGQKQYDLIRGKISETASAAAQLALNDVWVSEYIGSSSKYGGLEDVPKTSVTEDVKDVIDDTTPQENKIVKGIHAYYFLINKMLAKSDTRNILIKGRNLYARLLQSNKEYIRKAIIENIKNNAKVKNEKQLANLPTGNKFKQEYDLLISEGDSYLYNNIPEDIKQNFLDIAGIEASKTFFKNSNWLGKAMYNLQKNHPILAIPVTTVLPFGRMAWNLMMTVADYSPVGFVKLLKDRSAWKKITKQLETNEKIVKSFETELKTLRESRALYNITSDESLQLRIEELQGKNVLSSAEQIELETLTKIRNRVIEITKERTKMSNNVSDIFAAMTGYEKTALSETMAKATVGTTMFILGVIMYALGAIDVDDEDYMGVVLRIGGVKIRLSDFSPISSSLGYGAYLMNVLTASKEDRENAFTQLVNGVMEDTILSFTTDAIEFSDNFGEYILNVTSNLITQYIPNAYKALGRIFDQTKAQKSTSPLKRFYENIVDAIPGLRNILLEPKINAYTGKPEKRYDLPGWAIAIAELSALAIPVKWTYRKESAGEAEAKRVEATTTGASGKFKYRGDEIKLTGKELTEFKIYRAEYIKEKLNDLINTSAYKKANDEKKKDLIKNLYSKASDYAKKIWLSNNSKSTIEKYIKK